MKRKFSLFVTIVVCLLLVVGILSACNDPVEGLESVAGSYFMKDDSAGWWELGLDGQWLNSLGERGTYEFTPGEGDEFNGELAFYDATGAVVYTGNVQGAGLGIKGDTEVLWNLEKNPNTVNFEAVYAYAAELGFEGDLEELVKLFKGDSAYGLAKKYGYSGTEKDWLDSLRGKTAFDYVVEFGYTGTLQDWVDSLMGVLDGNGKSAYEIACELGFEGDEEAWLQSLVGKDGNGILGIEKTGSEGNVDIYTIYYTNGGTTTFKVTNAVTLEPVTVTFYAEGGTIPEEYQYLEVVSAEDASGVFTASVPALSTIEELPVPEYPGYIFIGWFTGDSVNDGQFYNDTVVGADISLFARWEYDPDSDVWNQINEALPALMNGVDELFRGAIGAENEGYLSADFALSAYVSGFGNNDIDLEVKGSFKASYSDIDSGNWALAEFETNNRKFAFYSIRNAEGSENAYFGDFVDGEYKWNLLYADVTEMGLVNLIREAIYTLNEGYYDPDSGAGLNLEGGILSDLTFNIGSEENPNMLVLGKLLSNPIIDGIIPQFFDADETADGYSIELNTENIDDIFPVISMLSLDAQDLNNIWMFFGVTVLNDSTVMQIGDVGLTLDFDIDEQSGELENLALSYDLALNAGEYAGAMIDIDFAVDSLAIEDTSEPAPYSFDEMSNAEESMIAKASFVLPMSPDTDDDVTIDFYVDVLLKESDDFYVDEGSEDSSVVELERLAMLITAEQYGVRTKIFDMPSVPGNCYVNVHALKYLFGMEEELNPTPLNAEGVSSSEDNYVTIDAATADEVFDEAAALGVDISLDFAEFLEITCDIIIGFVSGNVDLYAEVIKEGEYLLKYLYNDLNYLFDNYPDGYEGGYDINTHHRYVDNGGGFELVFDPDYTTDPDAPLSVDAFLAFFRNMGLNFTGLEESLFTQLGRVSLVGNADGSYTLTVGEWETVFEIGLSTEEEMYAE